MHTSAHHQDQAYWPQAEYKGTLVHSAEVRTAVSSGGGVTVPMLCMDVELDNLLNTTMHIEQPFPSGHFTQCHAAAKRLKKGMRVTVQAPLAGMRLVVRNATHIHILHEQQEQAA